VRQNVYLDHNATSPLRPEALTVMTEILAECGNPSSIHRHGRQARQHVEKARTTLARLTNSQPQGVIFTGSGTEANNLALKSLVAPDQPILLSAIEHDSLRQACPRPPLIIPVTQEGVVDLMALDSLLAAQTKPPFVAVMGANNETGVLQPIEEIAKITHRYGGHFHCDAVQLLGKIPINMLMTKMDSLSLAAHKIGGPQGVGALIMHPETRFQSPLLQGGGQEQRRRAGTENVAGIAGFAAALNAATTVTNLLEEISEEVQKMAARRNRLEEALRAADLPLLIAGETAPRLPHCCCLMLPGWKSETQLMVLDLAGISASAGSACSSGKIAHSHVLTAMGYREDQTQAALRISLGYTNTEKDIEAFLDCWLPNARKHIKRSRG